VPSLAGRHRQPTPAQDPAHYGRLSAPAESYSLRATTILRREDGQWRACHRHADPAGGSEPARDRLLGGAAGSTGAR
jgi:hypothetical protein